MKRVAPAHSVPHGTTWRHAGLAALAGLLLLAAGTAVRLARVHHVTALPTWSVDAPASDNNSPTGWTASRRKLVGPDRHPDGWQWLVQVQESLSTGSLAPDRVGYDQPPTGRPTCLPLAYRAWLAGLARMDSALTGTPPGRAAERAASYADPLLFGILLTGLVFAVVRARGFVAGLVVSVGLALLFPFAGSFIPAQPDHRAGALAAGLAACVLLVLAARPGPHERRRGFAAAGALGALALWLDLVGTLPLLFGISAAAIWGPRLARAAPVPAPALPWRWWSGGGALVILLASFLEGRVSPAVTSPWLVHPLHALIWLGIGEIAASIAARSQPGDAGRFSAFPVRFALAVITLGLGIAWALFSAEPDLLRPDPAADQLTKLPGAPVADSVLAWAGQPGMRFALVATTLPILAACVLLGAGLRAGGRTREPAGALLLFSLGATTLAALFRLPAWNLAGAIAVVALAHGVAAGGTPWLRAAPVFAALLPGLVLLWPRGVADARRALRPEEVESLVHRDLAHWLAARAGPGGVTVLAPPATTAALIHFGGARGLATLASENVDGLTAALRILAATGRTETLSLLQGREVTHLVLPSWDPFFTGYIEARPAGGSPPFLSALEGQNYPVWLRPLAYPLPDVPGLSGRAVTVLVLVEDQPEAEADARLAEYFVETGRLNRAASIAAGLGRFPSDPGALAARAQVYAARRDTPDFNQAVDALAALVERGEDRYTAWDRRVSMTVVLFQARRRDAAASQWRRCAAEMTAENARSLSPAALAAFLLVGERLGLALPDPELVALARSLLPPAMRAADTAE